MVISHGQVSGHHVLTMHARMEWYAVKMRISKASVMVSREQNYYKINVVQSRIIYFNNQNLMRETTILCEFVHCIQWKYLGRIPLCIVEF